LCADTAREGSGPAGRCLGDRQPDDVMQHEGVDVLERLQQAPGAEVVLGALGDEPGVHAVGGAVRDALLGHVPRELDLVVEGDAAAVARRAAARAGGTVVVHERFGTATVSAGGYAFDLAAARRETYPRPGALPEVELGATLEADLRRRDFTVNAIAARLADGALTAVPGAREDLDAGVLRVLHERSFSDDPTRLLRLARYAARLRFTVDPATDALAGAAVAAGAVATVTGERLGAELRLLAREPQPAALVALERHGLGAAVLGQGFAVEPGLVRAAHDACPPDARRDLVALAVCCAAVRGLRERLDALGFPARERDLVVAAATAPARHQKLPPAGDAALWRALRREPPEAVAVLAATGAAAGARRWLDDLRHRRLAIGGDDLVAAGLSGPAVGRALEAATVAMLDGGADDREAQMAAALGASCHDSSP
jgi:tRNA nucleotidyltransferase (CCA-adding enzyme)